MPKLQNSKTPKLQNSKTQQTNKQTTNERTNEQPNSECKMPKCQNEKMNTKCQNAEMQQQHNNDAICNLQSAICNLQSAICNLQSAICNLQSAICILLPAFNCAALLSVFDNVMLSVVSHFPYSSPPSRFLNRRRTKQNRTASSFVRSFCSFFVFAVATESEQLHQWLTATATD